MDIEDEYFLSDVNKEIIYDTDSSFEYDNSLKPPRSSVTLTSVRQPRSRKVSANALKKACYLCEYDKSHYVFKRRNSNINYTEPHHLIPLSAQKYFPQADLDREQNVVSLCCNCYNRLHYGADIDDILLELFKKRKQLLQLVGINIEFNDLKNYYK